MGIWVELSKLALTYGYWGVFILALICNLTFFLPAPVVVPIYAMGVTHSPLLLGLSSGLGSTIGEFSSYVIGMVGKKVINNRYSEKLEVTKRLLDKYGALLIFIFALTPLPDDLLLVTFGVINYDLRKAFFSMLLGKIMMNTIVAYAGKYSFPSVWSFITATNPVLLIILGCAALLILYMVYKVDWDRILGKIGYKIGYP